jgi:Fe-S-cluster containining protein
VHAWLGAATDPVIAGGLEEIYSAVSRAVAQRGPVCWSSGRCCHFEKAGHRLYVTGLEAAYALTRATGAARPGTDRLASARAGGGCPFQSDNLCTIHAIKPLGCRVYFCDASAQEWQRELSERMLGEIRGLHDRQRIDYRYAEWRWLLESMAPFLEWPSPPVAGASEGIASVLALPVLRAREAS